MLGYKSLKTIFRLLFLLFQAFLFISGVAIFITTLSIYLKERKLLNLSGSIIFYSALICSLHLTGAIAGFFSIKSKRSYKVTLYIISIITLMNLQAITIVKSSQLTENIHPISKKFWNKIDDHQKMLVEESLNCCGFSELDKREKCKGRQPCLKTFVQVSKGFKNIAMTTIIALIFCESLSIALICLLKLRK